MLNYSWVKNSEQLALHSVKKKLFCSFCTKETPNPKIATFDTTLSLLPYIIRHFVILFYSYFPGTLHVCKKKHSFFTL